MEKLYMGIDQSYTYTGWCVLTKNKDIVDCGVISSYKHEDIFTRANHITTLLGLVVQKYVPEIAIEGLAFGMIGNATRDLAGLQFVIICHLKILQFKSTIIAPTTIKKHARQILQISDPLIKMTDMKRKQNMHLALPQKIKEQLEPYKFLKTKGLYDVVDAWWLSSTLIDLED
jgi:hypothetical protein